MSFNLNLLAYIVIYMISILFLISIFFTLLRKLKKYLSTFHEELFKQIDHRIDGYHQKTEKVIDFKFEKTKKSFDETIEIQRQIYKELQRFNHFIEIKMVEKIEFLNKTIEKRDALENEIIKLKKIIKRRENNV